MWKIIYKTKEQLQNLRESGKYLTELLYLLYDRLQPWICWNELEKFAQKYIDIHNLKWAFKWYNGFPTNLCISINDCVVHGIPNDYVFKDGDLVKIDAGIVYKWMISDAAFSKIVGGDDKNILWADLIKATKEALDNWVKSLEIGKSFYNLWKTVFNTMKKYWFSVIKTLTGHWVGVKVHECPHIYNYPNKELKQYLVKNWMTFAIEPITAIKSTNWIEKKSWDWPLYCEKWDLWAQWEYTIIVDSNKIEVVAWIQQLTS